MKAHVTKVFDSYIRRVFKHKADLVKLIVDHPRKQMCIDNICKEIVHAETQTAAKMDTLKFLKMITGVAHMFADAVIKYETEQIMTEATKDSLTRKTRIQQEVKDDIKELSQGKEVSL